MKATEAQIKEWKRAFGEVFKITVMENKPLPIPQALIEKGATQPQAVGEVVPVTGYFKKPSLEVIAAVQRYSESDPTRAQSEAFTGCWIDGDRRLVDVPELMLSASLKLMSLIKIYDSEMEKL